MTPIMPQVDPSFMAEYSPWVYFIVSGLLALLALSWLIIRTLWRENRAMVRTVTSGLSDASRALEAVRAKMQTDGERADAQHEELRRALDEISGKILDIWKQL